MLGLTSAEVNERTIRGETNAVTLRVGHTYWQILRDNNFTLFNFILLALILVLLVFRDYGSIVFASFSVVTNSLIGSIQEISAKRTLDRLANLAASKVDVWRDGKRTSIPTDRVVKDDILPIEPGVRLVSDGEVIQSDSLEMDESLLTGESDAVQKAVSDPVYSGSYCTAGSGIMKATRIGNESTASKLSLIAKSYRNVKTPTQVKVDIVVELAVIGMLVFGPMVIVVGLINELMLLETAQNALVLVTSFVPQGLVLVTTLSLTLGAVKISRRQTLVQRINAVESLANVNVLCFDKTGTLTRNQLSVVDLIPVNGHTVEQVRSQLTLYTCNLSYLNKTAAAIATFCEKQCNLITHLQSAAIKQQEIPFTSARRWGAIVFAEQTLILGAPERILGHDTNQPAMERACQLAVEGYRVLAFACSTAASGDGLDCIDGEPLALVVLSDQIRDDIQQTLQEISQQAVDLKVISGDNLETVKAIASQAGIAIKQAYSSRELECMSDDEFQRAVSTANLFARIEPETKRKIVRALKAQGAYVAMVGDGVNDVPALKEANLAIAMNDGAQIAKDVADIVLLNNAMSTLALAFAEGKNITQKIYATARIFLSKNVYHVMLFILTGFMTLPFPINPVQISWVIFGVVNIPSTLIAFGVIRPAYLRNFTKDVLIYVVASGVIGALGMGLFYTMTYLSHGWNTDVSRSAVMLFLTLFGILVFLNTQGIDLFRPHTVVDNWACAALAVVLTVATIIVPFIFPSPFEFVTPSMWIWILLIFVFAGTTVALNVALRKLRILKRLAQLVAG